MTEFMEVFSRIMNIADRVGNMEQLSYVAMAGFGVILIFGILNCILGYRLLRFWMMLGGFGVGAGLGFFAAYTLGGPDKMIYAAAMLFGGILFAVIAFLIYKAGIFLMGAGIGWTLSIYILHPTTSSVFFVCILCGIGVGSLAVKYCREVLIVATSIIGGVMAGMSLAKLGSLAEFPYGIGMSVGFSLLGILIQFAINKKQDEDEEQDDEEGDEDEEYDDYDREDDSYEDFQFPEEELTPHKERCTRR